MTTRLRLTVLCGGQSPEHEISLISVKHVLARLDETKYQICVIYIDKQGQWWAAEHFQTISSPDQLLLLLNKTSCCQVAVLPGHKSTSLRMLNSANTTIPTDVIFPVLHGENGEDGRLQGMFDMIGMPYIGAGCLSSALCMDKAFTKQILQAAGIPVVPWIQCKRADYQAEIIREKVSSLIGFPCFVKPACTGSSIGITKVKDIAALDAAVLEAFQYDNKVLIEKGLTVREIECAVLGNEQPKASLPGEVKPLKEFYDYESKYFDPDGAALIIPAELPENVRTRVRELACQIYRSLDCRGMARVDFFLTPDGALYLNEVNTIPGFTHISLYPKCWEVTGIAYAALLDQLIALACDSAVSKPAYAQ